MQVGTKIGMALVATGAVIGAGVGMLPKESGSASGAKASKGLTAAETLPVMTGLLGAAEFGAVYAGWRFESPAPVLGALGAVAAGLGAYSLVSELND